MRDKNHPGNSTNARPGARLDGPENAGRRRFLKAALVSSTATLAVGAAGVVGVERANAAPAFARIPILCGNTSPGGSTGTACITTTNSSDYVEQPDCNNRESLFLWALFTNLPAGSYHMTVSPTIEPKGNAICSPLSASHPFEYNGSSSDTSNARVYALNPGKVKWECSPRSQSQLGTPVQQGGELGSALVTVTTGQAVQLQIHMQNGCSGARTDHVTVKLFQGNHTTPFLTASTSIRIKA